MIRSVDIRDRRYNVKKYFMIEELSDGCSRLVIGFCVITLLQRSANWIPLGLVRILLCPWQVGHSGFSGIQIHPLSLYIART